VRKNELYAQIKGLRVRPFFEGGGNCNAATNKRRSTGPKTLRDHSFSTTKKESKKNCALKRSIGQHMSHPENTFKKAKKRPPLYPFHGLEFMHVHNSTVHQQGFSHSKDRMHFRNLYHASLAQLEDTFTG
jgi:hypothetical protein